VVGWEEIGDLLRAARAAIKEAGDPGRAAVRVRRDGRVLFAVPIAAGRELEPCRLRGELPAGLVLPAGMLRLAGWAGLRGGEVGIHRAGRSLVLIAEDEAGCVYPVRW